MEQRKDYVETQIEMLSNALRKLFDKIKKLKSEEVSDPKLLSESIVEINNLSLLDLVKIEDEILVQELIEKYHFTNTQIKILADILYEYINTIRIDKIIYNKVEILYRYYQENERKTTDFIAFSRLIKLAERIKENT